MPSAYNEQAGGSATPNPQPGVAEGGTEGMVGGGAGEAQATMPILQPAPVPTYQYPPPGLPPHQYYGQLQGAVPMAQYTAVYPEHMTTQAQPATAPYQPMQNHQYVHHQQPPQMFADGSVPPPAGGTYQPPAEEAQPHQEAAPARPRKQRPSTSASRAPRKSLSPNEAWNIKFNELKEFHAEFGHCDVPQTYKKNRALGKWVGKQREHYKTLQESGQSPLTEERITNLATLGFRFQIGKGQHAKIHGFFMTDKLIENWEERFKELVAFKEEHGHCDVPVKYTPNTALGRWVAMQRRKFRSVESKEITSESSMLEDRLQRLKDIGFKFEIARGDYIRASRKSGASGNLASHDQIWEDRLSALQAYKDEHGNCDVPLKYKADPKLAGWVAKQRELWRNKQENKEGRKLTDERIAKLEALGFHFRAYEATWEAKLAELKEYKAEHGDVIVRDSQSKALWHWCKRQRDCFKDFLDGKPGPMTHERIRQLEELGFDWKYDTAVGTVKKASKKSSKEKEATKTTGDSANVDANGEGLPAADAATNGGDVPEEESGGGGGTEGALPSEENAIERATAENNVAVVADAALTAGSVQIPPMPNLGGVMDTATEAQMIAASVSAPNDSKKGTKPEKWLRKYEELVAFKDRNGHTRVPCRSKEYPKLGCWVKLQREDYRKMKDKKTTPMCKWRLDLLEKIGFEWRLAPSNGPTPWEERFAALEEFKREHGHCLVPQAYPKNVPLGKWVSKQRDFYRFLKEGKPSRLDDDKIAKLESIGFQWFVGKGKGLRTWKDYFEDCKAFKAKFGHTNIPLGYEENPALGTWANQQRKNYRKVQSGKVQKKDVIEHNRMLEEIGFNFHASPFGSDGPSQKKGTKASKDSKSHKRGRPRKQFLEQETTKDDGEKPRKRGKKATGASTEELPTEEAAAAPNKDDVESVGDGNKSDNDDKVIKVFTV